MMGVEKNNVDSPAEQVDRGSLFAGIDYRVARTREELEKAYGLVYREYLKRGYLTESPSQMRFSAYNSIPQTTTLVAIIDGEVVTTATVIGDSPLGLPMDDLYHDELNAFRAQDKKVCEISMLASDTTLFRNGVSLMLNANKMFFVFFLFKHIFDYVKDELQADYLCITINPKHSLTYDYLLFNDLGGLKSYETVNGAPAIAKYLDIKQVQDDCGVRNKKSIYKMFFSGKKDMSRFSGKIHFSPDDLRYFFVEKSEVFTSATKEQLSYIERCYPTYNFPEIMRGPISS